MSEFQYMIWSLFSIGDKIWVYEIFKSLHSVFAYFSHCPNDFGIEATRVPQNMMCKGEALTLIRGFADVCLSGLPHDSGFLQLFQEKQTESALMQLSVRIFFSLSKWQNHIRECLVRFSTSMFFSISFFLSCWISAFHLLYAERSVGHFTHVSREGIDV